jgi:hypothetical protein
VWREDEKAAKRRVADNKRGIFNIVIQIEAAEAEKAVVDGENRHQGVGEEWEKEGGAGVGEVVMEEGIDDNVLVVIEE